VRWASGSSTPVKDAFTATVLAGTTESMISWENGIGKLRGGDGGADLSPAARSSRS